MRCFCWKWAKVWLNFSPPMPPTYTSSRCWSHPLKFRTIPLLTSSCSCYTYWLTQANLTKSEQLRQKKPTFIARWLRFHGLHDWWKILQYNTVTCNFGLVASAMNVLLRFQFHMNAQDWSAWAFSCLSWQCSDMDIEDWKIYGSTLDAIFRITIINIRLCRQTLSYYVNL